MVLFFIFCFFIFSGAIYIAISTKIEDKKREKEGESEGRNMYKTYLHGWCACKLKHPEWKDIDFYYHRDEVIRENNKYLERLKEQKKDK